MPHYRLVADHGRPTSEFDAETDQLAEARARTLSHSTATTKATAFRLETQRNGTWSTVAAWLPRRVQEQRGGLDALVRPPEGPRLSGG